MFYLETMWSLFALWKISEDIHWSVMSENNLDEWSNFQVGITILVFILIRGFDDVLLNGVQILKTDRVN